MTALTLLLVLVQAQAPEWKAGAATVKITPEEPVFMSGYAQRNKPSTGVLADIWAKALALEDAAGGRAVLVTTDLIGLKADIAETIAGGIRAKTGLDRARILLSSSHTHCGPNLGIDSTIGGARTPEDQARTVAYTKALVDKVVGVAVEALGTLSPAKLSYGVGVVHFPMNRREFTARGVILGVNPRGPVDRSVPVLRVDAPDGTLRTVLFQCACHCTTLGGSFYEINGDYAGFAQAAVEKAFPGARAMFMAGCGGDANPWPRGTVENAKDHGHALASEVGRVLSLKLAPVRGPLAAEFARVDAPFQKHDDLPSLAEKGPSSQRGVFKAQLELVAKGQPIPTSYPVPISVWQFGDDLTLVGLSGEVVVDYVLRLEKALGPLKLWVAAYCHDVFGYLPSARVLEEGGYETRGVYYGSPGIFAPEAEAVVVRAVAELAAKAGRKP